LVQLFFYFVFGYFLSGFKQMLRRSTQYCTRGGGFSFWNKQVKHAFPQLNESEQIRMQVVDRNLLRSLPEKKGQVYFVPDDCDHNRIMGVFKPEYSDEVEEGSSDISSTSMKNGIHVEDSIRKEVAAYLLDHDGFAGVPKTRFQCFVMSDDSSLKFGSYQEYIEHQCTAEDLSSSKFNADNVHAIALLDLRLLNLDRHVANLLVGPRSGDGDKVELVPIDHAYSLPDFREMSDAWFEWTWWPQATMPLSPRSKAYVENLDVRNDAHLLQKIGLRFECILTNIICTTFLKKCVRAGCTLRSIALACQRDVSELDTPSLLESFVSASIAASNINYNSSLTMQSPGVTCLLHHFDCIVDEALAANLI
jgi:hypothetical protein